MLALSVLFPVVVSVFTPEIVTVFTKATPDTIKPFPLPVITIVPVSPDQKELPVNNTVCVFPLYVPVELLTKVNCAGNVSWIVNKLVASGQLFA